jgi:hypothetical protein
VKKLRTAIGSLLLLLLLGSAHAEKRTPPPSAVPPRAKEKADSLALERERLQFEERKFASETEAENKRLAIENKRLEADVTMANWSKISSALALIIPLVVALGTIIYGVWSFGRQAQQQAQAQAAAATLQFELKAAEIAFAGKTPEAVMNRAKALSAVFPKRLPPDFVDSFDPQKFGGGKQDPEGKKFFLELLTKCCPQDKAEIFGLWRALFGDRWLEGVESLLTNKGPVAGEPQGALVSPAVTESEQAAPSAGSPS